jgi:hypothetical protein
MSVRVTHTIDTLAADLRAKPREAGTGMTKVLRKSLNEGKRRARINAKSTARKHGKHYPDSITAELRTPFSGEFGPEAGKPQGGMSFERGSRNQPPHRDLERAADAVMPGLQNDVGDLLNRLFW